jgi:putative peptidoglycan lipid II flippase
MCIIGALVFQGIEGGPSQLAITVAWGAVVGSIAQFAIQLPSVVSVGQSVVPSLRIDIPEVRSIVRNFIPTTATRGLAQISAYIDQMIVSLLPIGAVTGLANAQLIYTLPVSLFGMSISASELPELSRLASDPNSLATNVKQRLDRSIRYLCFNVIPCSFFFLFFGDILARGVYQTGAFKAEDAQYVWYILAGSTVGLLAGTTGRLLSSTLYALQDAKTPFRLALLRVTLASGLGFVAATYLPRWVAVDPSLGVVGITASSGFCS